MSRETKRNQHPVDEAVKFSDAPSGWESRIGFNAATLGWVKGSNKTSENNITWTGDLCLDCATELQEMLLKFLADGVAGMVGVANRQEKAEPTA